jgi:anti-sigma B factor antagonist
MAIKLDRSLHEGVDVVNVCGEIDLLTAPALKETIYELLDSGVNDIILDMTELDFMDSAGLGVLVSTLRRVRMEGTGSLSLVCDRDNILKLFSITGLDKVFDIYTSMEECNPCRR